MSETTAATLKEAARSSTVGFLASFAMVAGQQKGANEALVAASNATNSLREKLLRDAAAISFASAWLDNDAIAAGVDQAVTERNAADGNDKTPATIKTFSSQLKLAMDTRVRAVVPHIFDIGTQAWDAEGEMLTADSDAAQPLRVAFKRRTHMLVTLLRQVREHGATFADADAIVAYGIACDPAKDDEKIAKKLAALRKTFDGFYSEFPLASFKAIDGFLATIKAKDLREARDKANAEPQPASNLRKPEPAPQPQPASDAPTDIIADAIGAFNATAA